ncbi:hypothetical protein D3C81_1560130 [compost metagenome]
MAPWCRVFHHSTEYLMIGMLITPTMASTAQALAALSRLLIAWPSAIMPKYRNSRMSMDVRRASQTHQLPQVGLPQMAPVTSATAVIQAPMGAAHCRATSAIFIFHTRPTTPATASIT